MTKVASSNGGGNGCSVGLDFEGESLDCFVCGLAMDTREDFVLKVSVIDTGDLGGHGQTKV